MLRQSFLAAALVAVGLARDPGCGGEERRSGGPNAPCTRSKDCNAGLVCSQGVCADPDAGPAAEAGSTPDANGPGDASDDGG